jgi:DNA polymerase-4
VSAAKLENMGLRTCGDVQNSDLAMLLKRFGKFGRILWERSHGIDEREITNDRQRKSVGVERAWRKISTNGRVRSDYRKPLPGAGAAAGEGQTGPADRPSGIKLKFNDFS